MIHKYLFFREEDKIETYQYRDSKFELIRYQGEDFYSGDIDSFWYWWEKTISFIESSDRIDFLFISESDDFIYNKGYPTVSESTWNLEEVNQFLVQHLSYAKIQLSYNNIKRELVIKNEKISDLYTDEYEILFYLSSIPNVTLISDDEDSEEIIKKERRKPEEESKLSKYYRKKTESFC
ncbi:hypothetical protein JCM16358_25380 [Halanaerocella petrolearia]